jgi:hypothetical protein
MGFDDDSMGFSSKNGDSKGSYIYEVFIESKKGNLWDILGVTWLNDSFWMVLCNFMFFFHKDLLRISSSVRTDGNDLTRGNYPQISGDLPLLWFKQ